MKKLLIVLAASLVLCVSAFADSPAYFAVDEIVVSNGVDTFSASGNGVYFYVWFDNSFYYRLYAISESSTTFVYNGSTINCDISYGSYYRSQPLVTVGSSYTTTPPITYFEHGVTDADIQAAFADFLANSPAPTPGIVSSFTVPCGNVLYFQVSSEQDITLSAQMPQLSYLVQFGNNAYGPWGNTGIEFGPAAALPTSGTTFPILSMDAIQWAKGEPKNILGQSRVGIATKHCIVGQWYALFCPLTSPQVLDASTGDHAMGASVVASGSFSQIKVYPLSETLDYDNPLGATYESGSNDGYDSYFDGSSDENGTVTWTNQDGQVQAPQSGGTNYVSPAANAESLLSQIRQLLANIVSELKSLFTFGYEAVQDLVGIMRDFVNVLGGLYTWLPAEVYSALMSAVVVAIVIGVFKVFL